MNKEFKLTDNIIEKFIDCDSAKNTRSFSKILCFGILFYSIFVYISNFIAVNFNASNNVVSLLVNVSFIHILFALIILVDNSKYKDKFRKLTLVLTTFIGLFAVLSILSYFSLFNLDKFYYNICETKIFGLYNTLSFTFMLFSFVFRKWINLAQILAIIDIVLGLGGFLYYIQNFDGFLIIFHYVLHHLLFAIIFLTIFPNKGIMKLLHLKTSGSRLAKSMLIAGSLFLVIFFIIMRVGQKSKMCNKNQYKML